MASLKTNIRNLPGIYKRYANPLEKLGIIKLEDFLYHIPFRYDDFSIVSNISEVQAGEVVTIRGEVLEISNQYTRSRITIQKGKLSDDTGIINITWFNQPYLAKNIQKGNLISVSGKIEEKKGELVITSPEYEIGDEGFIHTGRLVPVYPETRGISSKWIRRQVYKILIESKSEVVDFLPEDIKTNNNLADLYASIYQIHFPNNLEGAGNARKRLEFDELFLTQAGANLRRFEWNKNLKSEIFKIQEFEKKIGELIQSLPFKLTGAQEKAKNEIFTDLSNNKPMNRLLEGDVGSGKTVVAALGMYLAYLNGFNSILMAPTEILAQQHYKTINNLLSGFGVKVELLTSSTKSTKNKELRLKNIDNHQSLNSNHKSFNILIGTHALLFNKVNFENLGLLVIDEQQRFGVEQRSILRKKGKNPHVLTMTATPIPRTIALTLYGDLDLSVLDEMPLGRKSIKTWLVPNEKREKAYEWIKKQIKETNTQVFIVCPFIEESESMVSVKAATKEFENLKNTAFKEYKLALLHGKLKSAEKEKVLTDFKNGKYDILVATPVVEVGIDIPNADIILIEASERFGLSQLHQLRGRVGRRDKQAYCLLFTESGSPQTRERLKSLEKTNIGAELAELDLRLRGPGEIFGTRQSGHRYLKIASFSDFELIKTTKKEAEKIIPQLNKYPVLKEKIEEKNIAEVSPD
jgi:ATP-dependent DNA helicase RecG